MNSNKQNLSNKDKLNKAQERRLKKIFPDIDEWPKAWAGMDYDIPVGEVILVYFKKFLVAQQERLAVKTLKDYGNYLWALGGEIIRDTSWNEIKAKDLEHDFLLKYVDESGGPYWRHAMSESDQDRYDSICCRFYKWLVL
jgi:hypothetical protein